MHTYRHIIWDWNGTLVDDIDCVVGTMAAMLARRSLPPLTLERYREVFEFPVRIYYEAVGLDLTAEPFESLAAEWMAGFLERWPAAVLRTGALDTLERVRSAGITQSVLSAAERSQLEEQTAHFGVAGHFTALVGIDNHHAEGKIGHGLRWLEESALAPEQVLLVGDTTHDVEVGAALGCDVVLVAGGHQSRRRLEATGAPVVDSLAAVVHAATGARTVLSHP
jgi:phosphoglycolate phosphatase